MRILITGSSGQIGSNLGLKLLEVGHEVVGVDIRPNVWTTEIPTMGQDLSIPFTRIGEDFAENASSDLNIVVHFANHAKVHELVEQPQRALENIAMNFNVLEFCRLNKLPIIFGSSREVYGNIFEPTTAESSADFARTESPYAASKIAGESLIYAYAQCYDLPYLVFRFSNVYGRFDNDLARMERVIPKFIDKIAKGEPITIYGQDKILDFTYIDDCVSGVLSGIELLASGQVTNQTINLAYGQGNSLGMMAAYIGEALGIEPAISYEPSRVGEVTHYIANIEKARDLLAYEPRTTLRDGIRKAVAWNEAWQARPM